MTMDNYCKISKIEDSPLLKKISNAIAKFGNKADGIWISISKEGENFQPKNEDIHYWVKWLSWSLINKEQEELFEPNLVIVHGDLTEKQISNDLSNHFNQYKITIDNEIYFD